MKGGAYIMYYNQYPYNIFNQESLSSYNQLMIDEELKKKHHNEQMEHITKMRKSIRDYVESARKVTPDYQELAFNQSLEEILILAANDKI